MQGWKPKLFFPKASSGIRCARGNYAKDGRPGWPAIPNPKSKQAVWILYFRFRMLDLGFCFLDFGSWVLDFGFWLLAFGLRTLALGFWALDFGSWILVFGFCTWFWFCTRLSLLHGHSGRRITGWFYYLTLLLLDASIPRRFYYLTLLLITWRYPDASITWPRYFFTILFVESAISWRFYCLTLLFFALRCPSYIGSFSSKLPLNHFCPRTVNQNQLSTTHHGSIEPLRFFRLLDVQHNRLTSLPESLGRLPRLRHPGVNVIESKARIFQGEFLIDQINSR